MSKHCAALRQTPFCCGWMEAGAFDDEDWDYDETYYGGDTPEELIETLLKESDGRPVLFTFVKYRSWDGKFNARYEAADIREAVQTHPNVMHLWKGINPGSKNRLDSYLIKDYKKDEQ